MKRLIKTLIAIASIAMIFSCTGEDGEDGLDGEDPLQTTIYELENINFTALNDYSVVDEIPDDVDIATFYFLENSHDDN